MAKINIDTIREEASKNNWKLLSDEYKNLDTELIFECNEGHKVFSSWKKTRDKFICPTCESNRFKGCNNELTSLPKKKAGVKRILALDQATYTSGYSVFDGNELVKYGVFTTSYDDEIERDNAMREWLINAIENWKPDRVILEGIQLQQNLKGGETVGVTTFEKLARLQGILLHACFINGITYEIVHTGVWRSACGVKGRSRADKKKSAQLIVKNNYDLTVSNDEADAILIGKYGTEHLMRQKVIDFGE